MANSWSHLPLAALALGLMLVAIYVAPERWKLASWLCLAAFFLAALMLWLSL